MGMQCPYCEQEMEAPDDDYEEDRVHWSQCPHCEKEFVFRVEMYFTYTPERADCLNNGEHQYKRTNTWPREYARMRCPTCDQGRPMTPEEAAVPW